MFGLLVFFFGLTGFILPFARWGASLLKTNVLTTLRLANRMRAASLALPLSRIPPLHPPLVIPCLQQLTFCSDRPSRPKTKVCSGESKDKGSKGQGEDKQKEVSKKKAVDCCSGKQDAKDAGAKPKTAICDKSQEESVKEAADKEESECSSGKESDQEGSESSEEEEAKAPTKECEEEMSEHSEDEGKQSKAVSEMCDCVKSAVAKSVDNKQKDVGKPSPSSKSIGKPGPCTTPKEKEEAAKPKVSEHVQCCNVERSKSAPEGGKSGVEKCKSFKRDEKPSDKGKGGATLGGNTPEGKVDPKNTACECIKKALEKCKKGGVPEDKKPDAKSPDKKPDKKPDDKKKPDKKPDAKKPVDKKPGDKKPDAKKPDDKKPGKKVCNKNKKPVVKCK